MAKIKVYFDNENYQIDESLFSDASSKLQSHLLNVMNGSGATIKFGGTSYNIDSTKLQNATNNFTSHLGTIAGNGRKVVVNGVEYSIDSGKVQGAVAELKAVLGNTNSGEGGNNTGEAYAIYDETDKGFYFVRSETPIEQGTTFKASNGQELTVSSVYTDFEDENYYIERVVNNGRYLPSWVEQDFTYNIEKVILIDKIKPISIAGWFIYFYNCTYFDVSNLNTSNVTNMNCCFYDAGQWKSEYKLFEIKGTENWDTSNVTDMWNLFNGVGEYALEWKIGDLSNWDTSNVTDMTSMFTNSACSAENWYLGDLSNWDTSNVIYMSGLFRGFGQNSKNWSIGDLSNWDTSNVTDMSSMFSGVGYMASDNFEIKYVENWDTSNVTNMMSMFENTGVNADYNLDLSGWDVSNVTNWYNHNYFSSGAETKIIEPNWID